MANGLHPRVSIILEWENALNADHDRARAMLRALSAQVAGCAARGPFEVLLVYDAAEFSAASLSDLLAALLRDSGTRLDWRLLPAQEPGYYQNKNQGARAARGDVLVFLDSDVIPEDGWLPRMLALLDDDDVRIGVGSAFIEPTGLVGKTFAMTWFFPLREEDGIPYPVQSFFANNLVMRRDLYTRFPFPEPRGAARGGCIDLAAQLREAGIAVLRDPGARVGHPAPNGWRHIRDRALAQGRDRLGREKRAGHRWGGSWIGSLSRLILYWGRCWDNVFRKHRKVGLNPLAIPLAGAIACTYYLVYFFGEAATHLGLAWIRRVRV